LNREEAISIQKEILTSCQSLKEESISLVQANPEDTVSHGYQLHIKSKKIETDISSLRTIAEKHNLKVERKTENLAIIYRPCYEKYSNQLFRVE
jgi:hypothetical protein